MFIVVLGALAFVSLPLLMLWVGFRQFDKRSRTKNGRATAEISRGAGQAATVTLASVVALVIGALIGGFVARVLGMILLVAAMQAIGGSGDGATGIGGLVILAIPFGALAGAIVGFRLSRRFRWK